MTLEHLEFIREHYFLTKVENHLLYLMIKNNHGPVFILKTIHEYEYEIEDKNPEHSKSEN